MAGFNFGTPQPSNLFGGGAAATPGFGATTTTASTGFGFGTTPATNATTGFGFGTTPATSASTGFGFGTTPAASGFGTNPTTAPGFGGFGAPAASTAATGIGFGGFGTQAKTTASTGFGFGGFGAGAATSSAPSFGFGTQTAGATTGFGGTGGFGGFGMGTTGAAGTTGFGLNTGQNQLLQQQQLQQQQQQQPAQDQLAKIAQAVSLPQIFGDERDAVIAKWNQIQALWGTGKGYYSRQQFVEFKPDNPFCRFKAVGYNCMPQGKNEDGLVSLIIKQPVDTVKSHQQQALDTLHKVLGSSPQHTVCAEAVNPLPDNKTELVVYVMERPQMGPAKRCPATDLYNALSSPNMKQVITTQLNVETMTAKVLTKDQLKQYLDNPPAGINPLLWQQAILDNPDPEKLIPVPMIGFKELHKRLKFQEQQTKLHQQRLDLIAQDQSEFQNKQSNMLAKLDEYKRKHLELSHRLLQVVVKQEVYRKQGFAIQADEEQLRVQLEALQVELNHPTQFKGRLNELMSQIRMQNHLSASRADVNYQMDPSMQLEIKQLLKQQQEGLTHLIDIAKEDVQDLNVIEQGLTEASTTRR